MVLQLKNYEKGVFVFVSEGTYQNTGWVITQQPVVVDTDPIQFYTVQYIRSINCYWFKFKFRWKQKFNIKLMNYLV